MIRIFIMIERRIISAQRFFLDSDQSKEANDFSMMFIIFSMTTMS